MSLKSPTEGVTGRVRDRQTSFHEWRSGRPFAGGLLLCLSGLAIAWVPLQFAFELMLVGGTYTYIGLVWAVGVFLSGAFALYRPDLSTILGVVGIALSILSLLGALGGLFVGLLLGILGGSLCIAWEPNAETVDDVADTDDDADDGRTDVVAPESSDSEDDTDVPTVATDGEADGDSDGDVAGDDNDDVTADVVGGFRFGTADDGDGGNRAGVGDSEAGNETGADDDAADGEQYVGGHGTRFAVVLALLVVTSGTVTLLSTGPAAAILGTDRSTYTVDVAEIRLDDGGEICARAVGPDTYRVTISEATLVDVTIYQHSGSEAVESTFPTLDVAEPLVMYTSGQGGSLQVLSRTVGCTEEDQTTRTVFRNRYQTSSLLRGSKGVTVLHLQSAEDIPEPGGFRFASPADENGTGPLPEVGGGIGDAVGDPTGTVPDAAVPNGTVGNVTEAEPEVPPVGNVTDLLANTTGDVFPIPPEVLTPLEEVVGDAATVGEGVGSDGHVPVGPTIAGNVTADVGNLTDEMTNSSADVTNLSTTGSDVGGAFGEDAVEDGVIGGDAVEDGVVGDGSTPPTADGPSGPNDEGSGAGGGGATTQTADSTAGEDEAASETDSGTTPEDGAGAEDDTQGDDSGDSTEEDDAETVELVGSAVEETDDLVDETTGGDPADADPTNSTTDADPGSHGDTGNATATGA